MCCSFDKDLFAIREHIHHKCIVVAIEIESTRTGYGDRGSHRVFCRAHDVGIDVNIGKSVDVPAFINPVVAAYCPTVDILKAVGFSTSFNKIIGAYITAVGD